MALKKTALPPLATLWLVGVTVMEVTPWMATVTVVDPKHAGQLPGLRAGVKGRLFHDFRRTASRNLVRAGVPVPVAMKITGHRTDSTFRRYAIVNEGQKIDALRSVAQYQQAEDERKQAQTGTGIIQ